MREPEFDFAALRRQMVQEQLQARDIIEPAVLAALGSVPREHFVDPVDWDEAYEDHPLGIDCDQTISQPYIVALMTQLLELKPGLKVLEIGTGSGYQAAVLARMGVRLWTVERHPELSRNAQRSLAKCGLGKQIHLEVGDGSAGWPDAAPYDRILLTCCAPEVPSVLTDQLAEGGLLIAPVEKGLDQVLRLIRKVNGELQSEDSLPVIFVKLIGRYGYPGERRTS